MEENKVQVTNKSKYWISSLICGLIYLILTVFLIYFYLDTKGSFASNTSVGGVLALGLGYALIMALFCVGGYILCGIIAIVCFFITLSGVKKGKCEKVWLWLNLVVILLSIGSIFIFINLPV